MESTSGDRRRRSVRQLLFVIDAKLEYVDLLFEKVMQ